MKKISVIIPAKDEEEAIVKVIQSIPHTQLRIMGYEAEVIIVDSSSDGTAAAAEKAGARVINELRLGYGRAYKTGFKSASGDIIVTTDADMTYPIEEIPTLISTLEGEKLDFITTNRYGMMDHGAMSLLHKIGNFVLTITMKILFGIRFYDSQSGMWVLRREIIDKAVLRSDSMAFSEELKIEACHYLKKRCKEVPITYRVRVGKVKIQTWKHGFNNLLFLFRKRIKR